MDGIEAGIVVIPILFLLKNKQKKKKKKKKTTKNKNKTKEKQIKKTNSIVLNIYKLYVEKFLLKMSEERKENIMISLYDREDVPAFKNPAFECDSETPKHATASENIPEETKRIHKDEESYSFVNGCAVKDRNEISKYKDKEPGTASETYEETKRNDTEMKEYERKDKKTVINANEGRRQTARSVSDLKIVTEEKERKKNKKNIILDEGWAWMVLLSSFLANVIVDGAASSFGVFYVLFLEEFGESRGLTSWIGSLQVSLMYLMGNRIFNNF